MNVKVIYSTKETVNEIVADLKEQLKDFDYNLVQFYASSNINPHELSSNLYEELGKCSMFGCTTSGEIVSGHMLENSVVLMAMSSNIVADFKIEVLENISTNTMVVDNAVASLNAHFEENLATLNPHKHIGFVLIDGLSSREEEINERIGDLTNITFVGGSAGDNLKFENTYVFANGKAYTDAAVICLMKSNVKFGIIKTQSVSSLQEKLLVTKVDEESRTIIEFNNKPALDEYARLTGYTESNKLATFARHPLGFMMENDIFVRSPKTTNEKKLVLACSVRKGTELNVLETQDLVEDTKNALENKLKEFGKVTALINFNCIYRALELQLLNKTQEYVDLFDNIPMVGFTTYGESYIGHLNQTAIMLLFGE